ncbi:ATP-binding protein [Neolewinella antarctica]|uniref:SpoVK/Ycf46/Vps4 family AAA+-type ATPase n=1 Tax=Neolewinella antarctica TaxID=442734 RepID=A0ABX0X7G0_9BACT|nr:ATP-binding protein [Neolewinella antarctica]NJC24943.1 SpoVK/Ycf46/Vps4 family AAA+-type ATPase [Neolewinella antarctica]
MDHQKELNDLRQALSASPENVYIRRLLIEKLREVGGEEKELEKELNKLIRKEPHSIDLKEYLIEVYFKQEKYSTCLIIFEEVEEPILLSPESRVLVAKAYLKDGDTARAGEVYRGAVEHDDDVADDELDQQFRLGVDIEYTIDATEDEFRLMAKPDTNFSDVGGMEGVKREIDLKIIQPLQHVDLYKSYGKKVGGGILLYGPPGCGKTFIARATAGEINANFISVGLNDVLDMWIGNSEKQLSEYFDLARRKAPCVLFFDEVDALGAKRSDMRQSAGRNLINQFLAELDGIESNNEGLLIIGATNVPWHLDTAFRRPGRFDRIIFVPPPDATGREAILKLKLKDKPLGKIDYVKIAKRTKDFSGADLNAVIDIAIENILEQAIKTGAPRPIETKDLLAAAERHKPSTSEWFSTARNYATFANKGGLYDDILGYLK